MQVIAARRFAVTMHHRSAICAIVCIIACSVAFEMADAQKPAPAANQPQQAQAQSLPAYRARVLGVYDERSGDPISSAKITDFVSGTSSLTNDAGLVALVFLPDGGSLVRVQKLGYEPQVIPVSISPADTEPVTLLLRPMAGGGVTRLPGVTTTATAPYTSPALQGFEERMKRSATGYFIDDSTLRRNESHQLADLMRSRLPSVYLGGANGRSTALLKSPRCVSMSTSPPGPPQVYLDGVLLAADPPPPTPGRNPPPAKSIPFDLSKFQVSDLAGVEWYPSTDQAPVEYAGTSDRCGVLLLWTRER